jgi:hypothetical protein
MPFPLLFVSITDYQDKFMKIYAILLLTVVVSYCGFLKAESTGSSQDEIYSSANVWKPKDTDNSSAWMDCASEIKCILTYLEKSGASKPSIDFVKKWRAKAI